MEKKNEFFFIYQDYKPIGGEWMYFRQRIRLDSKTREEAIEEAHRVARSLFNMGVNLKFPHVCSYDELKRNY